MLNYGDRARGKVITVINRYVPGSAMMTLVYLSPRSEVVGRPLAALLANDGARVLSVDIDCTSSTSHDGKELIRSDPRILKTTLVIHYSIQIEPSPPHHTHHPHFGRLSEYLGCSHLRSPIAILQSPN